MNMRNIAVATAAAAVTATHMTVNMTRKMA